MHALHTTQVARGRRAGRTRGGNVASGKESRRIVTDETVGGGGRHVPVPTGGDQSWSTSPIPVSISTVAHPDKLHGYGVPMSTIRTRSKAQLGVHTHCTISNLSPKGLAVR